jgi:hypothetical protein
VLATANPAEGGTNTFFIVTGRIFLLSLKIFFVSMLNGYRDRQVLSGKSFFPQMNELFYKYVNCRHVGGEFYQNDLLKPSG